VLGTVAVMAGVYLVVSLQAGAQIAAAKHTHDAVREIGAARVQAEEADEALEKAAATGEVDLIGTGSSFANATARVSILVTSAAEGNAAGTRGLNHIQFVQGQLTTAVQRANVAVRDYAHGDQAGMDAARDALTDERETYHEHEVPFTGGLIASLDDLRAMEQEALDHQLESRWLNPASTWALLIAPVAVMLVLVCATGYVVVRHFRRYPGPHLLLALPATAAVGITTGVLCRIDARRLPGQPLTNHPGVIATALTLLAAAGVLAYLAYRPRLAEYRFPRS
jgi:hypothetical protein